MSHKLDPVRSIYAAWGRCQVKAVRGQNGHCAASMDGSWAEIRLLPDVGPPPVAPVDDARHAVY
jgi:hypothetical protein